MNLMIKIYRRLLLELSKLIYKSNKVIIKEISLDLFKIMAYINEDVGRQLYLFGNFEKNEVDFFSKSIKPGNICFDIGGNIGYFTLLFSKLNNQSAVHTFEPIKSNIQMIKKNVIINSAKNIFINESAVGDYDGLVNFSISKDSAFSSIHDTGRKPLSEVVEVSIIKIDTYVKNNNIDRIDVLKIDVEGAEEMVISGAEKTLTDVNTRPKIILIELYDLNLQAFGTTREKIINKMRTYGYLPYVILSGGKCLELNEMHHSRYYNIVFKPNIQQTL